jgi:hypothetical protein
VADEGTTATPMTGQTEATATTGQTGTTEQTGKSETSRQTQQTGSATTLAGGKTEETKVTVQADWPADWRAKLAGEDKAVLKRLERMGSPNDLLKSYRALETRLSSGELKATLPENATEEQIAEYRKANGVPDKPEAYVEALKLPDGMVPGEADKPLLDAFANEAQANNWTPAQYNQAVGWYYKMQDQLMAQRAEQDEAYKLESQIDLTQEWGPQFRGNLNAMGNLLSMFPEGIGDLLLAGRTADGQLIGNNPAILRGLVAIARELNPAATLLPAGSGSGAANVDGRITEIEKMMRTPGSDYWRSPAIQQEYRDLVTAREKMKGRAAT